MGPRIAIIALGLLSALPSLANDLGIPRGLPRLYFSSETDTVYRGGMVMTGSGMTSTGPATTTRRYFQVEGDEGSRSIGFLGLRLSGYIRPVPEARGKMTAFAVCRALIPVLIVGGASVMIGSLSYQMRPERKDENGNLPPPNLTGVVVGAGIALSSWIPYFAGNDLPRRSVEIYNSKIGR